MYYCIITETKEIYSVNRNFFGEKKEIIFNNIEEENKYIQLEYAAMIRFKEYETDTCNDNQLFNADNYNEWLKIIPQSENNNNLNIPTLSLMA